MRTKKLVVLLLAFSLILGVCNTYTAKAAEGEVTITVLETSDIHGMLNNHDYATDTATATGMVKVATVVKEQREIDPDLLLVDCGDISQGNFVSDYRFDEVHPVVKAMNFLKYDAWELGNHEFNYEFDNLLNQIDDFKGKVLAGNIYKEDGNRFVDAYMIKEVKGVKVAIFGMIAPHINRWESDPSHYNKMTFTEPIDEIGKVIKEIKAEGADVIIGLVHYGEDGEYGTAGMYEVAQKYADDVDAFLIGHSHAEIAKYYNDGLVDEYTKNSPFVMVEPGTNATNVGKVTITVKKDGSDWKVIDKTAQLIPTADSEVDADFQKELAYVHENSVKTANTVVGKISKNFYDDPFFLPGIPYSIIEDGPIIDLINKVQMEKTGADVSLAALFDASSNLEKGDFKKKDGVKVYKYDNTLMAVKVTGAQLKEIMEVRAGGFFNQYKEGDVTISFNENIRLYNYDMFAGVDYEIDISKPVGERIVNVMYKDAPLKDDEELILALNNYRFGALSQDGYIDAENCVYDSAATEDIPAVRDMIAEYVAKQGGLKPVCDNNWRIIGADLDDPQAELIYEMIRNGEIVIPSSADGRTSNIKAVNAIELRAEGILPELDDYVEPSDKDASDDVLYIIKSGDTLNKIAAAINCDVKDILSLNNISNKNMIYAGKALILPMNKKSVKMSAGESYTVCAGDYLAKIAANCKTTVDSLVALNNIKNANKIFVGQILLLP